ncbi:hypothetical protein HNR23_003763 [Nocardiopsis mwathae]|uniref:Uncharacterized protein n=1 Tax=Nocardiopsis mwathae TaxID=1472723 RepID=A0A7X0D6U2_9ACTN|nr:hypothetical protein [Nocardiopsis mwathae]
MTLTAADCPETISIGEDLEVRVISGMSARLSVVRSTARVLVLIDPEAEPGAAMRDARRILGPRERTLLRGWLERRSPGSGPLSAGVPRSRSEGETGPPPQRLPRQR